MILIELQAAIDAAGNIQTFYVSDTPFATKPTDAPANIAFEPTIGKAGVEVEVNVFADGATTGATELSVGEIPLVNADGRYDHWLNYSFEGRPVVIREGTSGAYPANFPVIFTGTVKNIYADRGEFLIRLVDKQHIFTLPVLTATYAGTNSGATGVEGLPGDIKGTVKARTYGKVFNIKPRCVNTNTLIYQVSDGAVFDIPNVYDRANELPQSSDYATLAALQAAVIPAGEYATCKALGLFRLQSSPNGMVTADVIEGANDAARTVAQILKRLALAAGVAVGDITNADVTALDAANAAVVGIYVDDERSYLDAMDELARSIGAYYGFDVNGKFVMGTWRAPDGVSQANIQDFYIGANYERRPASDNESVLTWSVKVRHTKFYEQQTSDIAGAVTNERRAALALQYRTAVYEQASIKTKCLLATKMELDTLLTTEADANAEGLRQFTIHSVRRDSLDLPIPMALAKTLRLATCVTVQISRFGLSAGKLMRVQGLRLVLGRTRANVKVWG